MTHSIYRTLAVCTVALIVSACGGGGGGGGGIGGTGGGGGGGGAVADVSVGAITEFGSVWVNGVRFNSDTATVKRDDNPVTHDANNPLDRKGGLRKGMIARVDGSISGASATTISVKSAVKGYVESVGANQMVVMGQTIVTDGATVFEDNIKPVAADYIEVHGQVVSDGRIAATFVETTAPPVPLAFEVKGIVKNHNGGSTTFAIGSLSVTLGAGAVTNDMPGGSWTGLQVEVKGTACASNPVCTTLTASKVEPEGVTGDVAKIEVEGFVTALTSTSDFTIGSQRVVTTGGTVFLGGLQSEIVLGGKLEAEGSLSGGVLTATKVSFRENIRFEANIASIGPNTLTLSGFPTLTIETNLLTKFQSVPELGSLAVGNNVRVRARPGSGNTMVATEIDFRSPAPNTDVRFQALATTAVEPIVTMLGIPVNTSPLASENQFKDLAGNTIGRAGFFAVAAGKVVKVRGTLSAGTISWDREIEIEE